VNLYSIFTFIEQAY